jgi:hypothetical protein
MNNYAFLGIVRDKLFKPLAAEHETAESYRLTSTAIQAAEPPDSGALSLAEYEGSAILVRGMDSGEWIYSAIVVEHAGLILTAVVQQVFGSNGGTAHYQLKFPLA